MEASSWQRYQVVGPTCDARSMNLTDGIDIAAELLPRKAKHAVGIAIVVLMVCWPSTISRFVTWYATEKSHDLVRVIERSFPTPAPIPLQPHPETRPDRLSKVTP